MAVSSSSSTVSSVRRFDQSARETVESIVVAVILAFLFRGFIAEAFVIPTGSMAPTLQGRHMDVVCSECGHQYRTGASVENEEFGPPRGEVVSTRCPLCRYVMQLDKEADFNQRSFNGDRILVSKFAYQFQEPQRWDVIVFKYPGNARINYIKRLVGLPGETLRIRHGDIYVLDPATRNEPLERQRFEIARKSAEKIVALLQLVDDSRYESPRMREAGWPERWMSSQEETWKRGAAGEFTIAASQELSWLRYRHALPLLNDWRDVGHQVPLELDSQRVGRLIMDYYAYNDYLPQYESDEQCWVGDLAVEADVELRGGAGSLLLDLVEGGVHFQCRIDTATGEARLTMDDGKRAFAGSDGMTARESTALTSVRGSGRYRLRFANVDDALHLWVNDRVVTFTGPTSFVPEGDVVPRWSADDPGDLLPVGIAAQGLDVVVSRLRVLRDVYYRALDAAHGVESEYDTGRLRSGDNIATVMSDPESWSRTNLFASRRSVTFQLAADQFFPLGDNSPQSKDARLWSNGFDEPPPYVARELLIGKALAIYWPHGWRVGGSMWGVIPNYQRIGLIR